VTYFKVQSWHSPRERERDWGNPQISQSGYPATLDRIQA